MRRVRLTALILAAVIPFAAACGENPPEREYGQAYTGNGISYEKRFWEAPELLDYAAVTGQEDALSEKNLRAVFFRGADYRGEETRVFAYLGLPSGATERNRVPGVVLVHGGGGTAYKEWVRAWTDRGFAALAIDYQGNMPLPDCVIDSSRYTEIPGFSSPKNLSFADAEDPVADQWMYWASAAAIIANSALRAEPQVDEARVGIAGISWGSIVTSVAIGYDDRFAFACPIYGGLYNAESGTYFQEFFREHPSAKIWEDPEPLRASTVPSLFAVWREDPNFSLLSVSRTAALPADGKIVVKSNWYHSHGGGMALPEAYAFAGGICGISRPYSSLTCDGTALTFVPANGASMAAATLSFTFDSSISGRTIWQDIPLGSLENYRAELPAGWEYCFVSVTDDRGNVISTPLMRNEPGASA